MGLAALGEFLLLSTLEIVLLQHLVEVHSDLVQVLEVMVLVELPLCLCELLFFAFPVFKLALSVFNLLLLLLQMSKLLYGVAHLFTHGHQVLKRADIVTLVALHQVLHQWFFVRVVDHFLRCVQLGLFVRIVLRVSAHHLFLLHLDGLQLVDGILFLEGLIGSQLSQHFLSASQLGQLTDDVVAIDVVQVLLVFEGGVLVLEVVNSLVQLL